MQSPSECRFGKGRGGAKVHVKKASAIALLYVCLVVMHIYLDSVTVNFLTRLKQVDPVTNTAPAVYWDCTPANARESLVLLLLLATLAPEDSVWMID